MKNRNKILSLLLLLIIFFQVDINAQHERGSLSLTECIKYAMTNNPDIKKASIEEEKSGKKLNEIIGGGLPQITLSGNIVNNLQLPTQLIPAESFGGAPGSFLEAKFGTKYNYTFTGDITQMIFNGSFWVGLSAAKYSNLYYKQSKEFVSENIEYNVATSYYQSLVVQKQIQLLDQNLKLISKSMADTKLLFENGKAKEVDVDRLNVSYNNLQYQLKKANETLNQSYNYLKFQMGMPMESVISLADSLYFTQDSWLEQKINNLKYVKKEPSNYENRNDYKILQTTLELQNLDKKNQIAQFLPSISAFGSYSFNGQRTSFDLFDSGKDWFKYYSVGLQFRLPIFTGGQTIARIQQSSLNVESLKEEIKKTENGIDMQLMNAVTKYNNAFENIKANKLNINLAQKVYDITVLEYKEGVITSEGLVDAETKLREAQTYFINSLLELYVAKFDLEKARGTLSVYLNNIENKNQ